MAVEVAWARLEPESLSPTPGVPSGLGTRREGLPKYSLYLEGGRGTPERLDTFKKVEGERGEFPVREGSIRWVCSIKAGPARQKLSPRGVARVGQTGVFLGGNK